MKKLLFLFILSISATLSYTQEQGKIRFGADIGIGVPKDGMGFTGNLNLKYNILNNLNAGIYFNPGVLVKNFNSELTETNCYLYNYGLTADYYFWNNSSITPFIGAAFGWFSIANFINNPSAESEQLYTDAPYVKTTGEILRAGMEIGKIRLSIEYFLVPETMLYDKTFQPTQNNISNNFLNLTLGFYIGGGRWSRNQ